METAIVVSGHTMGLGVARSLARQGVPVRLLRHDRRDMAHRSRHVRDWQWVPHPEREEERFIARLLQAPFGSGILIPTSDEALVAVSRHKSVLEQIYTVACPAWDVTRQCIDKHRTYALAAECGVPAPRTLVPASLAEAALHARAISYPCLVKPCQSHLFYDRFGRKMVCATSPAQLLAVCEQAERAGLRVMLQEIIPGGDDAVVNYNAYARDGEPLVEFTAMHVRNAPPRFGSPRVVVSRRVDEVLAPGRAMLRALKFTGYACTEFKRDWRDGVYKLMEVNARHNLSTLLAVRCGINFPWLHYRDLSQGRSPAPQAYQEGIYWIDCLRDLGYSLGCMRQERYPLRDYLRPYLQPKIFAILDAGDIAPFLQRVGFLAASAVPRLLGRDRERREDPASVVRENPSEAISTIARRSP